MELVRCSHDLTGFISQVPGLLRRSDDSGAATKTSRLRPRQHKPITPARKTYHNGRVELAKTCTNRGVIEMSRQDWCAAGQTVGDAVFFEA
jgi:hypothetical protein